MSSLKVRENKLRRHLARHNHRLEKTPSRHWSKSFYGAGYMVIENYTNSVALGCFHQPYDATLEQAEAFLTRFVGGAPAAV
ncbi:hypothetical protein [Ancylobacter sp. SL191]|uniref:hypothetical protein n=1 Tax=Ancylobacter sp. SL191 TaxID=2995166 RepID=UPI00226FECF9|nr:hypothetical protein [Ancylobacter sp. SL191]WAC25753.1 hypothetical protein OU996_11995 [Ancylobacter sp. SL191]